MDLPLKIADNCLETYGFEVSLNSDNTNKYGNHVKCVPIYMCLIVEGEDDYNSDSDDELEDVNNNDKGLLLIDDGVYSDHNYNELLVFQKYIDIKDENGNNKRIEINNIPFKLHQDSIIEAYYDEYYVVAKGLVYYKECEQNNNGLGLKVYRDDSGNIETIGIIVITPENKYNIYLDTRVRYWNPKLFKEGSTMKDILYYEPLNSENDKDIVQIK